MAQAAEVLEVLVDARPAHLPAAWDDLRAGGQRLDRAAKRGLDLLRKRSPAVHGRVEQAIGLWRGRR